MNSCSKKTTAILLAMFSLVFSWSASSAYSQVHTLFYDPANSTLQLDVNDNGPNLTTFELRSDVDVFTGPRPDDALPGLFDVYSPRKLFKLDAAGFGDSDFGPVVTPGLSFLDFANSLNCPQGSLLGGGPLGPAILLGPNDASFELCPIPPPPPPPRTVGMNYDSSTGELSVDVGGPDDTLLTTLLINSRTSNFITTERPAFLDGSFDIFREDRIFQLEPTGFGDQSYGNVLPSGLTNSQVAADICVSGSYLPGGNVTDVRLNNQIGLSVCRSDPVEPPPFTAVIMAYDPSNGNLSFSSTIPLTTLEIISPSGLFTGTRPPQLSGLFDVYNSNKLFKLDPAGLSGLDFGPALASGVSFDQLVADLRIDGSFLGGGSIVDHVQWAIIPEPSSSLLLIGGLLGLLKLRRRVQF